MLAGLTAALFVAAPIWWVPTSWKVTSNPPELHQNGWEFFAGNCFLFAMLAFLAGVAVLLGRRSGQLLGGVSPLALPTHELRESVLTAYPGGRPEVRLEADVAYHRSPATNGATDADVMEHRELVGFESSAGHPGQIHP